MDIESTACLRVARITRGDHQTDALDCAALCKCGTVWEFEALDVDHERAAAGMILEHHVCPRLDFHHQLIRLIGKVH